MTSAIFQWRPNTYKYRLLATSTTEIYIIDPYNSMNIIPKLN